jgi:hypothetical protein
MNESLPAAAVRLSAYYLNTRRLATITSADIPIAAQVSLNQNSGERALGMRKAERVANDLLRSGAVPELTREMVVREVSIGSLLAAVWGVFTFRGVSNALFREQKGKSAQPATFSGTIPVGDTDYEIFGELSNDHVCSQTSLQFLSGKRRILIAGQFEIDGALIQVHPYVIGEMLSDLSSFALSYSQSVRVYPSQIDAFAAMSSVPNPTPDELSGLRQIPEDSVKSVFAEIIGEPFVPKDWGGEKSDLSTSRLTIDRGPLTAAFIFKGPSVRGVMHPANMGKRGDQLVRAFDEPVDLVVIQHCHQIANSVVRQAEAMAYDPRHPRRYCIIDGADTIRIFKAERKLGFS